MLDPQTSGGLLISVPEADADRVVQALNESGTPAARIIGRVSASNDGYRLRFENQ